MQRLHRHVQLVAVRVLEHQEFARVAGDVHRLQADVAADAIGLVHHRRADAQVRQLLEYLGGIALRSPPAPFLARAIAEQQRLGENLERRGSRAAVPRRRRDTVMPSFRSLASERREVVEDLRLNFRARAAGRAAARDGRPIRPRAARVRGAASMCAASSAAGCSARGSTRTAAGATLGKFCQRPSVSGGHSKASQLNPRPGLDQGARNSCGRQIDFLGIENRALAVVPQLLVPLDDAAPETGPTPSSASCMSISTLAGGRYSNRCEVRSKNSGR